MAVVVPPTSMALIMEKIVSKDKDYRYMAVSDLQRELNLESFKIDEFNERRLCDIMLNLLEDQSGDISGLAVKCLASFVLRVQPPHAEIMFVRLCEKLVNENSKDSEREISSIALKTLIQEIKTASVRSLFVEVVTPHLLGGLDTCKKEYMKLVPACLEILVESLLKFGEYYKDENRAAVRDSLLPLLHGSRSGLRKKAMQGLAGLAPHFTDEQLLVIYESLFGSLQSSGGKKDVQSVYIQTLGALSKALGWRFGAQLPVAIPIVVQYCEEAGESDDEFRENCLQALEAFISKSPIASKPFLESILALAINGLQHDPNLAEDMSEDGDHDDDDDELSVEDYSDDEDLSWKVRRGAAKCLSAIVVSYPELLAKIYPETCPLLVQRFKEREESVKCEVLTTLGDLVRSIGIAQRRSQGDEAGTTGLQMLQSDVAAIVSAAARQLRDKSLKTKAGVFTVLKELVLVLTDVPWLTPNLVEQLIPGICSALKESSSNSSGLKIQALQFLSLSMAHSSAEVWQPHLPQLAPLLRDAVAERYYKVTAEALRTIEELVVVIRPHKELPISPPLQGLVSPLFAAAASRVQAQDQDQEVKEAAMMAACKAVAVLGDALASEVPRFLQVLLDRLKNEITRLAATKGITLILDSSLELPLKAVMDPIMEQLTSFLRKYHRPLRYAALTAIQAVVEHHTGIVSDAALRQTIVELAPLINDNDLMLAGLGLNVCRSLLKQRPDTAPFMVECILQNAVTLAGSPVIQGSALEAVRAFFVALMKTGAEAARFDVLKASLVKAGRAGDIGKAAQISLASSIASICIAAGDVEVAATVNSLLKELTAEKGSEVQLRLSLLTLGEIGRLTDLSRKPEVQPALTTALGSPYEDVKAAASTALGAVTVGNVNAYLPFLLDSIANKTADKYLLLKALNESIVQLAHNKNGMVHLDGSHQAQVVKLLLENLLGSDDEQPSTQDVQCRNVVAECLGHLALLHPPLLQDLLSQAQRGNGIMRQYIVRAIKATLVANPHPVDGYLVGMMPFLVAYLADNDRHVRKSAVEMLNAAAHNKPALVLEHLLSALPHLYQQTVIDENLIRTVDLGPFKHKIDDGLELRKVAFECMDVIFEACPDSINYNAFMGPLSSGLGDQHDIRMGCHLLLCKLASRAGPIVLANLDPLVPKLEETLTHKIKPDAVKQEMDRNEDMLRSCLRAVEAVQSIPNSEACASFRSLIQTVVLKSLGAKFEAVKRERAEAEGKDKA
eukprot:jgi/Botrbrau1/19392/Bobra.0338s0022.1